MIRVLIADDEMIERAVLYKTLKKNLGDRCEIWQAENGREALEIYEKEKIQIAVLDIEMPGVNGIRAAEKIREKDKDCCIIFLTAFDEFSYAKKAITVRALDYLLKPYSEEELMGVMEEAVRSFESPAAKTGTEAAVKEEPEAARDPEAVETKPEVHAAETEPRAPADTKSAKAEPDAAEADTAADAEGAGVRLNRVAETISAYVKDNYMYELSMQNVAKSMNYSEAYFCKLFKQCFNRNFTTYLTEYRVEEAKKLLGEPTVNVKEIGRAVGYADANYFAKVFKRITGQSPTEYRTKILQKET